MSLAVDAWADAAPSPVNTEPPSAAIAFTFDELRAHRFPPVRPILTRAGVPVFCAGHLGQVFAERGIGKTWLLQSLAMAAATGGRCLDFEAPTPVYVLYIDGEMSSQDTQERFVQMADLLDVSPGDRLSVVAADWQADYLRRLDTPEGQAMVEPHIDRADLILIDNRSCLFDSEGEKDPTAWQPAQEWLLSLRRRGKAVLMAHHANRQGGARGLSKSEDQLNLIVKLARPDNYTADQGSRFTATFEKARGAHGLAVAPFTASLTPSGWALDQATPQTSAAAKLLDLVKARAAVGEPFKSANQAAHAAGGKRVAMLRAWKDLLDGGQIEKRPDGFYGV